MCKPASACANCSQKVSLLGLGRRTDNTNSSRFASITSGVATPPSSRKAASPSASARKTSSPGESAKALTNTGGASRRVARRSKLLASGDPFARC